MKNIKKLISCGVVTVMLLGLFVMPVSAAWDWPKSFDMDSLQFDASQMVNVTDDNHGFFPDPADGSNQVLGIRKDSTTAADLRAVMAYTASAVQFEFDVYRTATDAQFELRLIPTTGGYGDGGAVLMYWDNGGVRLGGTNTSPSATYKANQWYNIRIRTNQAKNYHEVYMKQADSAEYKMIGVVSSGAIDFGSVGAIQYFFKNHSTSYTYFDNMSWTLISRDLKLKQHYDFDDVITTKGPLYSLAINANNMTYEQATFDGAQVLKSTMNETSAREAFVWEDVPDMEKVVVSAKIGMDSEGDAPANLPYQFGIRPVFAEANGTKGGAARNNMSEGIRLAYSRYFMLEGTTIPKSASDGLTAQGASIRDGKLYDIGYVYDRENKIFKAYMISDTGETIVMDASSNTYVQGQRYLAGIKLYSRSNSEGANNYYTGKGYYDYLYIDEAEDFMIQSIAPASNSTEVSTMPEIRVEYNYVIDPKQLGSIDVELTDSYGRSVGTTTRTYNGKYLIVEPTQKLESAVAYTVTVSGVKDLLGQTAETVSTSFSTASPVNVENMQINNGGKLIDGNNTVTCNLTSGDGESYDVTLLAVVYDKSTNAMLGAKYVKGTVPSSGTTPMSLSYDTSGFSNYKMEVYVWSGIGSAKPYADALEFTK